MQTQNIAHDWNVRTLLVFVTVNATIAAKDVTKAFLCISILENILTYENVQV
jgi:hypothetical protein